MSARSSHPRGRRRLAGSTLGVGFALAVAVLTGCSAVATTDSGTDSSASDSSGSSSGSSTVSTSFTGADGVETVDDVLSANADQTVVKDDEWSEDDAVDIALDGSDATTDADGVTVADGTVTITAAGVYRLSGDYTGTISVEAPDDALVVLILDDATITAENAPAIQIVTADDAAIFLADGSSNSVTSSGAYDEDADANAAIWSDADLTISGSGSLTVDGSANDGITSKDDLVVLSGTIRVTAADDGLRGKDSLTVRGGDITVDAGGDGLTSDQDDDATKGWTLIEGGTLDITAGSDGIDGFTDVIVTDGTITIDSEEGLEAGIVAIGGGEVSITSSDDGINGSAGTSDSTTTTEGTDTSGGQGGPGGGGMGGGGMGGGGMGDSGELVLIEGGEVTIDAEGDGLDSNGSMSITGGTVTVYGPTRSGNGGLDTNGAFTVSGGTVVAFDAGGMTESPDADSAQSWISVSASGDAGAEVEITDANGTVIATYTAAKAFSAVVFSDAALTAGETYTVTVDGSSVTATAGESSGSGGGMGGGPGA